MLASKDLIMHSNKNQLTNYYCVWPNKANEYFDSKVVILSYLDVEARKLKPSWKKAFTFK